MEDIKNVAFNDEMSERVDRFLRKEMSETEALAFTEDVKTNPELKEYYQRQFNLMRGIEFYEMKQLMKKKEADLLTTKETFIICITKLIATYKFAISSVAVAAAMVLGVFVWDDSRTRSVGIAECSTIMRGGNQIDELIKDKKYKEALIAIESQIDEQKRIGEELIDDPSVRVAYKQDMEELEYKRAILYLAMGKKHKAKVIIKGLDDDRYKKILQKLLW